MVVRRPTERSASKVTRVVVDMLAAAEQPAAPGDCPETDPRPGRRPTGNYAARILAAACRTTVTPEIYGPGNSRRRMSRADPCSPLGVCSASSRP